MSTHNNGGEALVTALKTKKIITGKFKIPSNDNILMDYDIENITFQNCFINGGDFCSSTFKNCIFDKVIFKNLSLVGVNFNKCTFIDCQFLNIQISFTLKECTMQFFLIR